MSTLASSLEPTGSTVVYVVEFTLHAKPGHYSDVADIYSDFAADFLSTHDALVSVMVVGDEADGTVRGIGVWEDRESAEAVNSDPDVRGVQRRDRLRCSPRPPSGPSCHSCTCSAGPTDVIGLT